MRKVKDDKDFLVDNLKHVNVKLRRKLKEMNLSTELAIQKMDDKQILGKPRQNVDAEHLLKVRTKEVQNAENQIEQYKKEIAKLEERLEGLQGVQRMLDAGAQLRDTKLRCTELEKEIFLLEKKHREMGGVLEKLTGENEY